MEGGSWLDLLNFFKYPDPPLSDFMIITDPDQLDKAEAAMRKLRNYHLRMSGAVILMLLGVAIIPFTPWGPVMAGDVEKRVAQAVSESVKSISSSIDDLKAEQTTTRKAVGDLKAQSDATASLVKEILRGQLSVNICRLIVRQHNESNYTEKTRLRTDADTEQERYRAVAGDYYPESRCGS